MFYDIHDDDKYYTQMNNILNPINRCKPTSTTEGLDLSNWNLSKIKGPFKQPEDNLTYICEQKYGKDSPEEWWKIKSIIDDIYGLPSIIIGPSWSWDIRQALFGITKKIPFIASTYLTTSGHVVSMTGFETKCTDIPINYEQIDINDIISITIDDPYGNKELGKYDLTKSGKQNKYSFSVWMNKYWRGTGIQIRRNEDE